MRVLHRLCSVVSCGLLLSGLVSLGIGPVQAVETVFPNNVRILISNTPTLFMEQTTPAQVWSLNASSAGVVIQDVTAGNVFPFNIQKGAPNQSIRVLSSGKIGFGIANPQAHLHIFAPAADTDATIRLQVQSPTSHSWDLLGNVSGFGVIDVGTGNAPFAMEAGAPESTLYLHSTGNVGLGTQAPDANSRLDIRSSLTNGLLAKRADANAHFLRVENSVSAFRCGVQGNGDAQFGALTTGKGLNLLAGGTSKMTINSSGKVSFGNPPPPITTDALLHASGARLTAGGIWTDASSRTFKQDIEPITSEEALDTVRALQPVGYRYKNELDERYVGFIAEDVPELVATKDRKALAPMDITAVLTKVVQDQDQQLEKERVRNNRLEVTVDRQQQLIDSLSKRLAALEQKSEREE